MWSNNVPNTFKNKFLIWANTKPKIETMCTQFEILNELDFKGGCVVTKTP
jgi:hypothetical protein